MSTHTPGPWRFVPGTPGRFRIDTPRGTYLNEWDSTASIAAAQHDANARLIAAAPEMLALLRKLSHAPLGRSGPAREQTIEDCIMDAAHMLARIDGQKG